MVAGRLERAAQRGAGAGWRLSALFDEIRRRILAAGPISVHDFMAMALGHTEHGYYRNGDPLGAAGDFVTAPEISQMFGELIGLWTAEAWSRGGRPDPVRLVELGPGRGTLMADALRAIAGTAPKFRAALAVHLVEANRTLRVKQARALADLARPAWHAALADVPAGPAIIIANEFFDALPIRQLVRAPDGWRERVVDYDASARRLVFVPGPMAAPPQPAHDATNGAIVEFCPEGMALARVIGLRVVAGGIAALIVDYGHAISGVGDTLQAVRRHQFADPLVAPGETDLTAHVDFMAIADAARTAGAVVHGPLRQGTFLARLGLGARADALLRAATPAQNDQIAAAVRRLIGAHEMGTLFKALAIVGPSFGAPAGFEPTPISADERA